MKKYSIILFLGSMILNASDGEKEADKKKGGIYKSTYPLHYAVLAEGYEQVKILCKTHSHLVNMYDHQSYSPLRRAVDASRADVVKLLLEHGAPSVEEKCPLGIDVRYRYMTVYAIEKGKTAALAGCFLPKKMTAERDGRIACKRRCKSKNCVGVRQCCFECWEIKKCIYLKSFALLFLKHLYDFKGER